MINLIPNEEKKKKVRDFYFRLMVVLLLVFSFSMLIASAAILPAYFLSSVKLNVINDKLGVEKNKPIAAPDQQTMAIAGDLKNKLKMIDTTNKDVYLVSREVINEIILRKTNSIRITQMIYDTTKGKKITISGRADSREQLLLFRKALEDDATFKKVDLPISNFVKGSNIQFSLTLIPSQI